MRKNKVPISKEWYEYMDDYLELTGPEEHERQMVCLTTGIHFKFKRGDRVTVKTAFPPHTRLGGRIIHITGEIIALKTSLNLAEPIAEYDVQTGDGGPILRRLEMWRLIKRT